MIQNQLSPVGTNQCGGGSYNNLFDAHPPFQIDGNFGGAAGIVEMLVRDRPQELELLPALMGRAWPKGHLHGVRLRGAMQLDLAWEEGKLTMARFTADKPVTRTVKYGDVVWEVSLEAGQSSDVTF